MILHYITLNPPTKIVPTNIAWLQIFQEIP